MALIWEGNDDEGTTDRDARLGLSLVSGRLGAGPVHRPRPGSGLTITERALAWLVFAWLAGLTLYTLIGCFDQWGTR